MKSRTRSLGLCTAALVTLSSSSALAQNKAAGFALDRFDPSVPGDAFFGVGSPLIGGHLALRASIGFEYAAKPLQVEAGSGAPPATTAVVSAQGYMHAAIALGLWDRLLVSLDMPVAVLDNGSTPAGSTVDYHVPSSASAGDLRIGLRGRIYGDARDPFSLGIAGAVFAPTGSASAYTGEGTTRGSADLLLGGRAGTGVGVVWSASGGAMLQGALISPLFRFGGGVALVLGEDRFQIGPELYGTTQIGDDTAWQRGAGIPQGNKTEVEVLGGARGRLVRGFFLGAAAGPGIGGAVGAPTYRVLVNASWAPIPEATHAAGGVRDRDGDGIADDVDACPDVAGVLQSDPRRDGCPIADRDHDGIPDIDDACPDIPGPRNVDATKNGCPIDTDEDGIPDAVDACPRVKGVPTSDPKTNGCPPDRDHDGVPDAVDACPDLFGFPSSDARINGCPEDPDHDGIKGTADACPFERGPSDPDPTKNGCPRFVRVEQGELRILGQIQFKSDGYRKTETVSPLSEELLKEIRDVIVEHPEINKIEVQGHTDDEGGEQHNMELSQRRAEIVRQWLVDNGIPKNKLVAKGYGWSRPIADNRIKQGRGQNRRVEFVILERTR